MPPLAIIYPSGNSTSLSILPHKSTPPAPVIISLLCSELSRVYGHLNRYPKLKSPFHQLTKAITYSLGGWHMLKRHFGLVDAIVEFKLISHMWPLLPSRMFLCNCCQCAPILPTSCCQTKIRSRQGLLSVSSIPLEDSPFQISPLCPLGFHHGPEWALRSSLW